MAEPLIGMSELGAAEELAKQLDVADQKLFNAVAYCAHLGALLREACDILEKMEVEVEVSEPLQFWWEKEKRKREAKNSGIVVQGDRGPLRDAMDKGPGSSNSVVDPTASGLADDQSVERGNTESFGGL